MSDRAANKNNKPVSRRRTKQHDLKGSLAAPLLLAAVNGCCEFTGGAEVGLVG